MKILAIETATEACSAALLVNDTVIDRSVIAPRQHTRLVLPMVDELLQEAGIALAELDAIAFGQGPGAFTGVRIAIGVTQGLAFAHDLPVVPVSSLAILAHPLGGEHTNIAVAIDARMQEIYWGLYQSDEDQGLRLIDNEQVCVPTAATLPGKSTWFGVGSGWQTYGETLSSQFGEQISGYDGDRFPQARDLARMAAHKVRSGESIAVEQAAPVYLRNKIVNQG